MSRKKPKQPGVHEYYDALIKHYVTRCTALVHCKGNLSRDDLEYLMTTAVKLKDERLKQCIAELVGWGDDERAELETMLAIGYEAMKLCSPSRLREAAMRVGLKYHLKEVNNATRSEPDGHSAVPPEEVGGSSLPSSECRTASGSADAVAPSEGHH